VRTHAVLRIPCCSSRSLCMHGVCGCMPVMTAARAGLIACCFAYVLQDCPEFTLVKNHTDLGVEHRRYDAGE
jgi:hypothetical protein